MNYAVLKTYIDTYIKENGNEEITGDILNAVLKRMTDDLGDYRFSGVIVPSSIAPQVTDINRWFITSTNGTYTNFGDIEVLDELAIITFDGTFHKFSVMSNYIRHDQLGDLNADNNYLHVTSAEKDNWNNADARGRYLLTNEIEGVTSGGTYALVKNKANEINTYKLEAGTHNFNFDTPTEGITNDYYIDFQCGYSAPTIVWGVTIDWGTSVPTIEQSKRYEIIIKAKRVKNGSTYTWVYDGTWESHGTI